MNFNYLPTNFIHFLWPFHSLLLNTFKYSRHFIHLMNSFHSSTLLPYSQIYSLHSSHAQSFTFCTNFIHPKRTNFNCLSSFVSTFFIHLTIINSSSVFIHFYALHSFIKFTLRLSSPTHSKSRTSLHFIHFIKNPSFTTETFHSPPSEVFIQLAFTKEDKTKKNIAIIQ